MPTILFVGDSITVGSVGSTDKSGFRGVFARKTSYKIGSVTAGLQHVGPFVDPTKLHHGGVGGATARTFGAAGDGTPPSAYFVLSPSSFKVGSVKISPTWMETYKPDFLHFMMGTNDIIAKRESAEIFADMQILLKLAQTESPKTKIFIASIVEAGPDWFTKQASAYNDLLRNNKTINFVDTSQTINSAFYKEGIKAITVDGTHPNQRGYDLMGTMLALALTNTSSSSSESSNSATPKNILIASGLAYGAYKLFKAWQS